MHYRVWLGLFSVALAGLASASQARASGAACGDEPHAVVVQVKGVHNASGNVAALLFGDNPDHFLKKGRKLARVRVPARKGSVHICLPAPKPGTYAVAVYHDENGNKKFDKSIVGLPVERYGVSNNPTIAFAPPSLAEAAFELSDGRATVDIRLVGNEARATMSVSP